MSKSLLYKMSRDILSVLNQNFTFTEEEIYLVIERVVEDRAGQFPIEKFQANI